MTTKEARLDLRLDAAIKARIERAAQLCDESVNAFVLRAAVARADRILAGGDHRDADREVRRTPCHA